MLHTTLELMHFHLQMYNHDGFIYETMVSRGTLPYLHTIGLRKTEFNETKPVEG